MNCQHDCPRAPEFPKEIHNRPGLGEIDYRIGHYAEMREFLLARLDQSSTLSAWTHRGADDPGIAVLESAAVVADILTFYQKLYANQAFLRTAEWKESVADLVKMLGYRLAPGVGGEALFALAVKGERPVTVPAGFGLKAQLAGQDRPADFESSEEIVAHPHLSRFHLYRPRKGPANIVSGPKKRKLELKAVEGASDAAALASVEIEEGDRLMLVPPAEMFDVNGTTYSDQALPEILVVASVQRILDRVVIELEGSLTVDRGTTVKAYKVDRSFRHFGHGSPAQTTTFNSGSQTINQISTSYDRAVNVTHFDSGGQIQPTLTTLEMPLDEEVDDLAAGSWIICQGLLTEFTDITTLTGFTNRRFTVVRRVEEINADSLTWGNLTGPSTVLTLDRRIVPNVTVISEKVDIRQMRFHETVGPELTLQAPTRWPKGAFPDLVQLNFFGTYDQALALSGRRLLLTDEAGNLQEVQVSTQPEDFSLAGKDEVHPWMWPIHIVEQPIWCRQDFDESSPLVTVYGNLVETTQGKTEAEAVLGSGDRRMAFQTFAIPKSPLTYLLDESSTPAQVPELEIYVDGILWQRVETFFDRAPDENIYLVREDDDGTSFCQFGDGTSGSRLPSGRKNVVAVFRSGVGATGPLEADTTAQAAGRLNELEEVFMPGPAVGGEPSESPDVARIAAPGRMQSLGRLVGLSDYEAEVLALPGVIKTRALWSAPEGTPLIELIVLTESGNQADLEKVRETLQVYNRCRGPARFPIRVEGGRRIYLYLDLSVGYEVVRRPRDIDAAVRQALGVVSSAEQVDGTGLFSLGRRDFGQEAHVSQIIGAVQQVEGVTWVKATASQILNAPPPAAASPCAPPPEITDPSRIPVPPAPLRSKVLSCPGDGLLTLFSGPTHSHLALNLVMDSRAEECSS